MAIDTNAIRYSDRQLKIWQAAPNRSVQDGQFRPLNLPEMLVYEALVLHAARPAKAEYTPNLWYIGRASYAVEVNSPSLRKALRKAWKLLQQEVREQAHEAEEFYMKETGHHAGYGHGVTAWGYERATAVYKVPDRVTNKIAYVYRDVNGELSLMPEDATPTRTKGYG